MNKNREIAESLIKKIVQLIGGVDHWQRNVMRCEIIEALDAKDEERERLRDGLIAIASSGCEANHGCDNCKSAEEEGFCAEEDFCLPCVAQRWLDKAKSLTP